MLTSPDQPPSRYGTTDMSAPTPAPGDDRPREGYYPDPSIPGYVRYWNGAAWVPGTSRPAPSDGETLQPPPRVLPAPPTVEETGPVGGEGPKPRHHGDPHAGPVRRTAAVAVAAAAEHRRTAVRTRGAPAAGS